MLDFRMNTFLAVCRHRNYTRAAEELNITQPAVTQHIQYLQDFYGVKLFVYANRQLTLTPEGELLREATLTMFHNEEKLKRDFRDMQEGRRSIRFGATLTIGEYVLPRQLAQFMKQNPQIQVHMVVENTKQLLSLLNDGQLDFAIVEGYFRKGEYDCILWSEEPFICVCAPDYPLPSPQPRLEDLLDEPLIFRDSGSGSREVLVRTLEGKNHHLSDFNHLVEISDLYAIKEMVRSGCGITFLYRRAAEEELARGTLKQVPIRDFDVRHEFNFLWRKNSVYEADFRRYSRQLWPNPEDARAGYGGEAQT